MSAPFSETRMLTLAGRAVGKVDATGVRGATLVTVEEVETMATALALMGVPSIPPGTPHDRAEAEIGGLRAVTTFRKGDRT